MRAMVLEAIGTPLVMRQRETPAPPPGEVLVEVAACGVCRTDLHVVDGELPNPKLPIVPGHEIVGRVAAVGRGCRRTRQSGCASAFRGWAIPADTVRIV